jgi:hypothetical protein
MDNIELLKNINESFVKNQKENLDLFSNLELSEEKTKKNNDDDNSDSNNDQLLQLQLQEQLRQLQKKQKTKKISKYQSFPPIKEIPEDNELHIKLNELQQLNNATDDIKYNSNYNYIEYKHLLLATLLFYLFMTECMTNLFDNSLLKLNECNYNVKLLIKTISFFSLYYLLSFFSKKYLNI